MIERVLFVNGTVGVGKTTIIQAVYAHLTSRAEPHAWIDLDALSECWPPPDDDHFKERLVTANLHCVAGNFAEAGATSLLIAGIIESVSTVRAYEAAVSQILTVVRLTASREVTESRLRQRHGDLDNDGLQWHLSRAPELDTILNDGSVPGATVENLGPPPEVAQAVLRAAGW